MPYSQKSTREASHDLMRWEQVQAVSDVSEARGRDYFSRNSNISHAWLQQWKATAVLQQPECQLYVTVWFKRKTELSNALSKHRHDSSYCSRWRKDKARAKRTSAHLWLKRHKIIEVAGKNHDRGEKRRITLMSPGRATGTAIET